MKIMRLVTLISLTLVLSQFPVMAQSKAVLDTPKWVTMMDDPDVNYYDALKAYDSYWKTHAKPAGEVEEMGLAPGNEKESKSQAKERESEREKEERDRKKLKGAGLEQVEYLKYQMKRFENWAREVKPWVQENGHVLTFEERQEIWKKQQEESRQQKQKK